MTEDTFKGGVHALAASLAAIMAAYNVMRWIVTHRRRNALNVALYAPLVFVEWTQVHYHWSPKEDRI